MSGKQPLCDPYFWENPRVLAGSAWLRRWTENFDSRCASDITNEVAAVYMFFFLIGSVLAIAVSQPYILPVFLLVATLYLTPAIWTLYNLPSANCNSTTKAGVPVLQDYDQADSSNKRGTKVNFQEGFSSSGLSETMPTARNPFMNVLVNEIKYNPSKPPAKYIGSPDVQDSLDSFFRVQWSSDPTDVFGKTQSQRQFVTMPSTSIPSDRGSFQDWLYKIPGKTCKEGGREACMPGTDGSPVTWLNVT